MQVSNANNVKIYNLSAGKSLPEWLTDRQRRKLQNKDNGNLLMFKIHNVHINDWCKHATCYRLMMIHSRFVNTVIF
ncbi:nucleolar protein 10 [Elysia marginata]|uniref:Nucleolar protein 10 n=1 Tax=Elysia marginata TaxID=1093978 RepID=A0AAV4H8A1_9GAST|nr:nucleolar protein 10 [Elysia marginata]